MFLVYINDIVNVSSVCKPLLYADETSMYLVGRNVKDMIICMNEELKKLVLWLNVNRLSLNIEKTNYIIFNLGRYNLSDTGNVCINGKNITRNRSFSWV